MIEENANLAHLLKEVYESRSSCKLSSLRVLSLQNLMFLVQKEYLDGILYYLKNLAKRNPEQLQEVRITLIITFNVDSEDPARVKGYIEWVFVLF